MSTVRDHIKRSMRLIGAIAVGETPSADEQADVLLALNSMLSSWSTESLMIFAKVREEFPLAPGQSSYTMGANVAANFNSVRPQKIENAGVLINGLETPIYIANQDEWAMIGVKNTQSTLPTTLYPVATFPYVTINLWPVPTVANTLVLYSWKPLGQFASANTEFDLPPGYEDAIDYNLAVRIAPEFGRSVSAEVGTIADTAKANVKRMNIKPIYLGMDAGIVQTNYPRFNILTGDYST